MKRLTLILTGFLLSMVLAIAQNKQVTGLVVDEDQEPVIGASVIAKGTTVGTVTDVDGKFSLNIPESVKTLVVRYIGMKEQEVDANANVRVVLSADDTALDEVVVVAYGTAKKSAFTGSASTVKAKDIAKRQVSDVSKALSGTMSGVQVASTSGQPGTAATIRIRGVGSISASSNPLYVVDGIPVESSLSSINSADIETITTLKDAAANSLYGARGANGVVLITTKKGTSGKTKVSLETRFGYNERGISAYDVVSDKGQYMELLWESLRNQGVANGVQNPASYASNSLLGATQSFNPFTNVAANEVVGLDGKLNPNAKAAWNDEWLKDPFRKGFRNEDILTISGGNGKTNYYLSLGYLTEDSYITASDFERYSARVKIDQEVSSWFKAGLNMSYSKINMNNPWASDRATSFANIFMFAQQSAPIYPIYKYDKATGSPILDKNGKKQYEFNTPYSPGTNPLSALENDVNNSDIDYNTVLGYGEVSFLQDFKLRVNIAAETYNGFSNLFQTPIAGDALNVGGRNTKSASKAFIFTTQQLLTYKKEFDGHNFDVLLGHESTQQKFNTLSAQKENFLIPTNPELINAARLVDASSYQQDYALESVLSRVQYDYSEKYFLSASIRSDGSSRFSPSNRWGTFWSVGGAWLLNKDFLYDVSEVNELKLKASYGTQGNDALLDPNGYLMYNVYLDQYAVSTAGEGNLAISYVLRGNPELKWEKSENFNAGVEFRFFDKFFGGVEYYQKITKDLLYQKPLATSQGLPNWIFDNAITMKNNGVEIELGYDIFNTNDFSWQVKGNLTTQKNKIMKLPSDKDLDGTGYVSGDYWFKVGGSIYDFYTYRSAGVDPATGKALWYAKEKDENSIPTGKDITVVEYGDAERYEIGKSAMPDVYGGFETTADWKGVDLSIQASYQIGGYGWDTQYRTLMTTFTDANTGAHKDVLERRWTTPGQITDVPRLEYGLANQNSLSDRYLTSKSYFSINNVTLGYSFPKKFTNRLSLDNVRVYVTGDNLALFSVRKGYDPRIYISGSSTYSYTAMRTFSLGLNVNF